MKKKEFIFDVEYIADHTFEFNGTKQTVSSHKMWRGINIKTLTELIKENEIPIEEVGKVKITLNIRGG